MPVTTLEEARPIQRVRFCPSAASELFWVLLFALKSHKLPENHEAAAAMQDLVLRERVVSFWQDGGDGSYTELFVLAQRADMLFEPEAEAFLDALEQAALARERPLGLDSETPEEIAAVRQRLRRLRDEPDLRRRYIELLRDVWGRVEDVWETSGRAAVAGALAEWPGRVERAPNVLAAIPKSHVTHRFTRLLEAAESRGEVVITPLFFADVGHLMELPGVLLVGVGVRHRDRLTQRRLEAEAMVNRLKVVTDPTRVVIVALLSCDALSVGDLVEELGLSQPTISVHVRQLKDAGLLDVRREGGRTLYTTTPERVDALLEDARRTLRAICDD